MAEPNYTYWGCRQILFQHLKKNFHPKNLVIHTKIKAKYIKLCPEASKRAKFERDEITERDRTQKKREKGRKNLEAMLCNKKATEKGKRKKKIK